MKNTCNIGLSLLLAAGVFVGNLFYYVVVSKDWMGGFVVGLLVGILSFVLVMVISWLLDRLLDRKRM